jgi:hypothetical protein
MRKALASLAGLLGLAALVRSLRRRPADAPPPAADSTSPAEELRRRLDEARAGEEPVEAVEPVPPRAVPLEERRARVHAQAQDALELMREPGSDR